MEDEAEIYDGIRAQFPLTFGKKSKPQTPLEAIHNTTRRSTTIEQPNPSTASFPSISSSSKDWLNSVRKKSNPKPLQSDSDQSLVGPPLPPSKDEDDGELIGPPPPPVGLDSVDDDGPEIGPPRPPEGFKGSDSDEDEDEEEEEEENIATRIPLSNEIVLKGHTKVVFFEKLIPHLISVMQNYHISI